MKLKLLLLLLFVLIPTAPWFWFQLPLNALAISIIILIAILIVLNPNKNTLQKNLLLILILVKSLTAFLPSLPSIRTCVQLHLPDTKCETKIKTIAGESAVYSVDYRGTSFPLFGFNQLEFNSYGAESEKRPYLPFAIKLTLPRTESKFQLISAPSASTSQDKLEVSYQSHNDPYANQLRLVWQIEKPFAFKTTDIGWTNFYLKLTTIILNLFISLLVEVLLISLISDLKPKLKSRDVLVWIPLLALAVNGTFLPFELALFTYFNWIKNKLHVLLVIFAVLVFSYSASTRLGCYSCQNILHPGSDPLSYEHFARQIYLMGDFLRAGESGLFNMSPLYRYFIAFFHLIGGESMWSVRYLTFLILFGAYWLVFKLFQKLFSTRTALISLYIFAFLDKLPQLGLLFLYREYYSESIALPALFLSIYLLLFKDKPMPKLSGLFLGLSLAIRNNYLPAAVPLLGYLVYKRQFKEAGLYLMAMLPPILFVIYRNLMVAGIPTFFMTSSAAALQPDLFLILYHGQRELSPLSVLVRIFNLFLADPKSVLIPIGKNILTMTGMIGLIPKSQVYAPIWGLGLVGLFVKIRQRINPELMTYISIFSLLFLFHLPFGIHVNGSAKYIQFILFFTPFAVDLICSLISRKLLFKSLKKQINE